MKRALVLALILFAGVVPGLLAQIAGGNIYGTVADESGAVLPGAAVTITSDFGTRTSTTTSQGDFRFLNLERGRYKVSITLAGFTSVNREVNVVTGENANLSFALKVATVAETVTVTAETPLVDVKKRGTATTMTTEELQNVPNARDPWGVLKNVPGVLLDRVNIAGNENGQQANSAGKGATAADRTWNLDGMNVTDMSATGASPTYFDFGAFQEITVTTGGADLTMQTGGQGINLVTKRGTNKFHGSARYLIAHHKLSSNNVAQPDGGGPAPPGQRPGQPHRADLGLRLRPGRPDPQGQALVLRHVREAGHPPRHPDPDRGQDPPALVQLQGQLAGHGQHDGLRLLLPGLEAEVRPQPGNGAQRDVGLPLEPGQRLHGRGPSRRPLEAAGRPHLRPQLLRVRQGRLLRHGLRPVRPRRPRQELHPRLRRRATPSARNSDYLAIRPQKNLNARRQLLLRGDGRQQRAEVRLRLPRT